MKYVVHTEHGEIIRCGECQEVDFAAQAGDHYVIEGDGHMDTHHVVDGVLTRLTAAQIASRSARQVVNQDPAAFIRRLRDTRLAASDWVVLRALEQNAAVPDNWRAYRQQLRDITAQEGFPTSVVWPKIME